MCMVHFLTARAEYSENQSADLCLRVQAEPPSTRKTWKVDVSQAQKRCRLTEAHMETATRLALAISLACCVYLAVSLRRPARYRRLPPSPPADFLGRTLFPPQYAWRYLYEVAKQQGPVLTIWRGTQPTVMCCDVGT